MVDKRILTAPDAGGVWHPGELALQHQTGEAGRMADVGPRVVRDYMLDQHRAFFAQLPFVVMATVDPSGAPWVGLRTGDPGFVTAPDARQLRIAGKAIAGDPMEAGLAEGGSLGLLGIELHSRRRNRMNGLVARLEPGVVAATVTQSFGNCPKYIQLRRITGGGQSPGALEEMTTLDDDARAQVIGADTFFVASYADRPSGRQIDVSHRGGRHGFVRVEHDGALTIPDFAGNHFFSTLGNILLTGRAGLCFVDFETGTLLQMTGRAALLSDDAAVRPYQGAERFWRFWPQRLFRRRHAVPLRFAFEGWSPHTLETGGE